jgi:predicted ATPase
LKVRVGVATGMVVVGDLIGEGASQEQAVFGETPNLAARLQSLADPGTVVICDNTRRLTRGHFKYHDLGPINVKGLPAPVMVARVLGTTGVESRFEADHSTRPVPLLGRGEEIELLSRRWRAITEGEGSVVVLTGEPGIGKSHITRAFHERLQSEPHATLHYFCSAHHKNSALFPFVGQIERGARFERGDSSADRLDKVAALVSETMGPDKEAVGVLAGLISLPTDERFPAPDMSPQKRKEKIFSTLLGQLGAMAARQPVLIIFEDLHWIDPTSLELLALAVERVQHLRVLLLVTARAEFTPPWPGHAHITTIPLTRLNRRNGAALIERITAGKPLPPEVVNQILARTDGVPLFIEELTKTLLESGQLAEQDGQYILDRPLPSLTIPTTLHASLTARLDRLAPVKEVAQVGAALGREFSYELLSAVAGISAEQLNSALSQLVDSELVFRRGEIPQAVFTFKHALVRDAAYDGLLKSRRAMLHASIASALERQFPEVMELEPETVAHHLTEAGLGRDAVKYWLQAGRNAAARSANLEAIAHLQRGVEAVGGFPETSTRDRLELDLHVALGPCLIATQGPASSTAMATFGRARELCERLGDPPEYLRVMFWLATASVVRGELPQAQEAISALLQRTAARGDRPALLNAMRGNAMILLFMGRIEESRAVTERALEVFAACSEAEIMAARAAGQDAGAAAFALMSWSLWLLGQVDTAVTQISSALARADAVQHPHTQAYVCYYASILHALRGEPSIAQRYAERCLTLSEAHEFRQWRGLSRAVRGICAATLDPASPALIDVRAALDEYRGAGYQLGMTALYVLLCAALLLRQESEPALDLIEQGLATVNHNSERIFEAELYRLKARALLMRRGADGQGEAEGWLERAIATARAQKARSLELRATTDLAVLWSERDRRGEAAALLAPIVLSVTEGTSTHDRAQAQAVLAKLR